VIKKNPPQAVPDIMFCDLFHIKTPFHKSLMQVKLTFSNSVYKKYNIDYEHVINNVEIPHPIRGKKNLTCINCTLNFIM